MFSSEKEKVPFESVVDPNKKNVEDWMGEVEDMMRKSIRKCFYDSIIAYPNTKRGTWCISHPG